MSGSSLAELKKRQQQRRQEQQRKTAGTKRKRDTVAPQQSQPKSRGLDAYFAKSTIDAASHALAQQLPSSASPFAASLRALADNPFDIISDAVGHIYSSQESTTAVDDEDDGQVVVVNADYSDSEADEANGSDYECELNENDPSLYKVDMVGAEAVDMMQVDDDDGKPEKDVPQKEEAPTEAAPKRAAPAVPANALTFSKPPESLSFRTHVSITSDTPLEALEPLRDESTFLSMTSLCSASTGPVHRIADSLLYWEILGAAQHTDAQIKQALASAFHLQTQAPAKYPFIYVNTRDFAVVFKVLASKRPTSEKCKRVAVVSRTYLGLRKILHNAGVEFSLPLAPQVHSWSELGGNTQKSTDPCHLHTTSADKTWRSAMLVTGIDNVAGLLNHLQSVPLPEVSIYASGAFLNSTMRRAGLRFATATTY
ncbi:hypothetical protein LPJ70_002782, partial [Coemansia sp. RSA 2708]